MQFELQSAGVTMPLQEDLAKRLVETSTPLWIGIIVAILVLAFVVHRVRAWYRDRDDTADHSDEILQQMRELHREGDLSEEEFRSIKGQLTNSQD